MRIPSIKKFKRILQRKRIYRQTKSRWEREQWYTVYLAWCSRGPKNSHQRRFSAWDSELKVGAKAKSVIRAITWYYHVSLTMRESQLLGALTHLVSYLRMVSIRTESPFWDASGTFRDARIPSSQQCEAAGPRVYECTYMRIHQRACEILFPTNILKYNIE